MSFRSMKKLKPTSVFFNLFLVFFVSSFFVGTRATGFDPCKAYRKINDPHRSTASKLKPGIRANCDFDLQKGWYRFTSIVGGQIPNTKPEPFYCNTIAPIWIRGELPKINETAKKVTACINLFNLAGGCKRRFPISVKYCDGGAKDDFYVYRLSPVRGCAMAYCAGNKTPCPRGMSGIMPKCNVSQTVEFPYKRVPRPKIDYVKNIDTLALSCKFDFPALGNVSFTVEWLADGQLVRTEDMCVEDKGSRCEMDNLEFTIKYGVFKMGQNVQCRLKMKYSTSTENKWSMAKYSNIFFVGIEITPRVTEIVVKECEKTSNFKVNLRPTVPIVYLESIIGKPSPEIDHLNLTILVPKKYAYRRKHIGVDTCSVQLRTKDILRGKNITIKATCDNLNEGSPEEKFQFHFVTETTYPPWAGYRPPALVIKINTTERRTCSGTGDPHYVTFDGRKFNFYQPGVYLMYSNSMKSLEVQARLWICIYEGEDGKVRWQVSCNCGVAIRERNDIVVFSVCNEKLFHQKDERKPIRYSIRNAEHKPLADGFHIYKKNKGNSMEYNVLLPSGTRVRVSRSEWGLDIYIDAPNTDKGKVSGFCGNFNNDTADDLRGKDGKLYADATQFAETWNISYTRSYFHTDPAPIPPIPSGESCTCPTEDTLTNNTINCNKTENYYYGSEWMGILLQQHYQIQKKRSADSDWYSDDIIDHVERSYFVDDLQVQAMMNQRRSKRSIKQTMSKEKATEYCRSHIEQTKAGRSCKDVSAESIEIAMEHCIIDLELSGDTVFAYSAFDFMAYECKEAIFKNISLYTTSPDGDLVPPTEVVQDLCPGDCSRRGNCTNQTCICKEGFTAQDCSMKVGAVPHVLGIYNGGLCDIRERPCRKTNMLGEYFVSSENLTCHVQEIEVFPGPWSPRGYSLKLHGDMYDLYGVKCDLPEPPTRLDDYDHEGTPAGGLLISVSNDGFNASVQKLRHVSYDSKCINCSISDDLSKCERKPNSCLIRGHCFAANEANPRDWCQQCLPRDDENAWTRRKINHAPKFTTNTTMFALRGEDIVIQLKATDPDNRPVTYSLLSSTASGYTLTRTGLLRGKVTSNEKFSFKVTDECGAFDTTDMRLRIVQCPCLNGGQCVPHPYHPRGSGKYQCRCVNGFSGDRCERCPGLVCPPRNLSVTTLSSTKIKVKWVEPQDKALDYYLLEYIPNGQKQSIQRVPKIKTSWTLTGLRKFTDYRIGVTVVNANRKKKVEVSAKTDEDVPDAPPVITAVTPVSHDTMKVTWSPIAENESNGIIKGYRIFYKPGLPDGSWGRWKSRTIRDGKATSATISRLKPATQYCFKMSAFTSKGQYRLWMVSECWSEKTPS